MTRPKRGAKGSTRGASSQHGRSTYETASSSNGHQSTKRSNGRIGNIAPRFSMKDEANFTERNHVWNPGQKLRHSQVNFVSAGKLEDADTSQVSYQSVQSKAGEANNRSDDNESAPDRKMAEMSLSHHANSFSLDTNTQNTPARGASLQSPNEGNPGDVLLEPEPSRDLFVVDPVGSSSLARTGLLPPAIPRSPSPSVSDSSEELVLFSGRNNLEMNRVARSNGLTNSKSKLREVRSRPLEEGTQSTEFGKPSSVAINDPARPRNSVKNYLKTPQVQIIHEPIIYKEDVTTEDTSSSRRRRRRRRKGRTDYFESKRDEEVLADYIANIDNSNEEGHIPHDSTFTAQRLQGTDREEWQDASDSSSAKENVDAVIKDNGGWDSVDLQDFDGLSTSSEAVGLVDQIISKRDRSTGVQYLVVWKGHTVDDARWVPMSSLTMSGAEDSVRQFEKRVTLAEEYLFGDNSSRDTSDEEKQLARDLEDELDDVKDEEDLWERKQARMTDEQIARLLSKQEELGLGSNDLMLFNDVDGDNATKDDLMKAIRTGTLSDNRPTSTKSRRQFSDHFASATAFADALDEDPYLGFDVMDHDRPSLRRTSKGRRAPLRFDLSDSELENAVQSAWSKDRAKKKIRKQERESLRAQGLLGKKNKPDLKAKYDEGMSFVEIKDEIRGFLMSTSQSLSLPPMDDRRRKGVHETAHALNLKSKSVGHGKSRFPVLYKTSQTSVYSEEALAAVENRLSWRFFPRMDRGSQRRSTMPTRNATSHRGGFGGATSYQDGEVVGADAPELGVENRGRAMLEKMGWSTGTALGAANNKGIMQPVAHVVKTTKAGLG